MNHSIAREVAGHLLEIKAIKLNLKKPFLWASGWKSPIYCDNRLSLSFPLVRTFIKEKLAQQIKVNFPEVKAIAGVATAGIPHGALVADCLHLPFIYVRSKPKGHGMENMIEGKIEKNQKVVLVEDLISTGGSSIKAANALRNRKIKVLGLAAIFTYGFEVSKDNFAAANINTVFLSNYAAMLEEALASKYITEKQMVSLKAWRIDPEHWS